MGRGSAAALFYVSNASSASSLHRIVTSSTRCTLSANLSTGFALYIFIISGFCSRPGCFCGNGSDLRFSRESDRGRCPNAESIAEQHARYDTGITPVRSPTDSAAGIVPSGGRRADRHTAKFPSGIANPATAATQHG